MSLFGSLYTGVMGMNAQSQSTANISNNIANLNTTGFKRGETVFADLVTNRTRPATFNTGGVTTDRIHRIDQQGQMQQTFSNTEIAVAGDGFFPVRTNADDSLDMLFTRNGAFSPDANGFLRNSAGFVLYAWPTDANGVPMTSPDVGSLVPADVNELNAAPLPTTQAQQVFILDASEPSIDPHLLGQELPVSNQPADFSRNLTVYDQNGVPRDLVFEYRKIVGPMAHFTSGNSATFNNPDDPLADPGGVTPAITAGDTLQVAVGGDTITVDIVAGPADITLGQAGTAQEVVNVLNAYRDSGGNRVVRASLTDGGRLLVQASDPAATIDISGSSASVLGAGGFDFIPDPGDGDYVYDPEASLTANGTANPNQTDLPAFANTTDPNTAGWWEMRVLTRDPADAGNPNAALTEIRKGLINFNGDGSFNALPGADGSLTLDLATVPIDFDSSGAGEEIGITVDISGYQQFAGDYTVLVSAQNGAEPGTLTNISIDDQGLIIADFTNGTQQVLYQVPLATFINPNGLQELSGTVFALTQDAGDLVLNTANNGGAGSILPSTIESSNVDLANEFSHLIVSQRAFSANSRVVNTVDEMTQLLRQLKV